MSIKENKALILRFYDLYNKRELEAAYELFAPEYVFHPASNMSREQVKQLDVMFYAAFPDTVSTIEDIIAEGDKVAFRVNMRGTHTGPFMGIAPTGNKIEMTNTVMGRAAGGKCVESWATMDSLSLMQQLDVIPKR